MRGTAIADAQAALQQGSGRFAELHHQLHGIAVHGIVLGFTVGSGFSAALRACFAFAFGRIEELLLIFRQALHLPEFDDRGDFLFGNKWGMQAVHARRT